MKKIILLVLISLLMIGCKSKVEMEFGETTGSSADMITYIAHTDPNNYYSFERPRYWIDKTAKGITEFDGPTKNGVYYTIVVPSLIMPKSMGGAFETKENYVAALENQWKTAENYKRIGIVPTIINNKEAIEIIAAYTYQGKRYKTKQFIFESDKGFLMRMAYTGPEEGFNDYMPVMDRMVETFRIIDTQGRI